MADMNFNVGGSNTNLLNGGGATDAVAVTDISGTDGAVISAPASVTMTDETVIRLNDDGTNGFAGAEVGHLVHVTFASVYASGRRPIVAVDPSGDWIEIPDNFTSTVAVSNVRVGGAVPILGGGAGTNWGLQEVFDDSLASAASDNVSIYMTGDETLSIDLDKDAGGGSSTTMWHWFGCDSDYVRITPIRLTPSGGANANGLLDTDNMPTITCGANSVNLDTAYLHVDDIYFTGTNTGTMVGTATGNFVILTNCSVANAGNNSSSIAYRANDSCVAINCDFTATGATAATIAADFDADSSTKNCRITNSSSSASSRGLQINSGIVNHCLLHSMSGIGIKIQGPTDVHSVDYCTFEGVAKAVETPNVAETQLFTGVGNIFVDCAAAYESLYVATDNQNLFAYYDVMNNVTNPNVGFSGDVAFQRLTSDPLFVSVANGNYDLQSGSPAKSSGPFKTNRGSHNDEESGGAGGLLTHPGMSGGLRG